MPHVSAEPAGHSSARPLKLRHYLAYGSGDLANNLCFQMAGMFLLLYYTNVVGVAAGVVGTMLLVVRVIDACTDLAAGRLIDLKKPGRLGKFKPFILWFALPLVLSNIALYAAQVLFPGISERGAVAYMYLTYILMAAVFYTLVNIAYGSMAPSVTASAVERSKLATFRGYGMSVALLLLSFVIAPQIQASVSRPEQLQRSLFLTLLVFAVVGLALYLFVVVGVPERRTTAHATPVSLAQTWRTLLRNTPLAWLCGATILFMVGMAAFLALASYIAIYVQGDATYIAWNALAQTAAIFIVGPFVPRIVGAYGKRAGYVLLGSIGVAGAAVLAFAPLQQWPALGLAAFLVIGFGIGGVSALMWALEADTVEYGQWRSGERIEGATYALYSFARKIGQAIGGFVGGMVLVWADFNSARASSGLEQAAGVASNIQLIAGGVVGLFLLASVLAMVRYPLTDSRHGAITARIHSDDAGSAGNP